MRARQLALLLLAVVLVAGFVLALLVRRPAMYPAGVAYSLPANFAYATAYDDGSLLLANGRSLVDYNYSSGQSKLVSPDNPLTGLDNLDSVTASQDKQYILFHAQSSSSGGLLYSQLVQSGLDPSASHWWVYSLQTQKFAPLPGTVLLAKFNGASISALESTGSGESLVSLQPGTLQSTASLAITPSSNFLPVQGGYLLQTTGNAILFTSDGTVSQKLFSNMQLVGVTGDQQTVIAVAGSVGHQSLVSISVPTFKTKKLAGGVVNQPLLSPNGAVLYNTATSTKGHYFINTYDLSTQKAYRWSFSGLSVVATSLVPVAALDSQNAIVSDSGGNLFMVGAASIHKLSFPGSGYGPTVSTPAGPIKLSYNNQTSQLSAGLSGGNAASQEEAIYQQLSSDGFNPNLIDVSFITNSGTGDE